MYKLSVISILTFITLISCNKESNVDNLIDDYDALMTCTMTQEPSFVFDNVTVSDLGDDRVEIDLGGTFVLTADVAEDESLEIDPFSGSIATGETINILNGVGSYSVDTIFNSTTLIKTINIFLYEDETAIDFCSLQLLETL